MEPRREAFVEDALKVLVPFFVFLSRLALLEEVRWRHLLRVANDHALLRARYDADRVPHRNLRRLVEDNQVERRLGGQILRDRQGAHQEARLEASDHAVRLCEQLADRLLARLLRALAADDPELASVRAVAEASERKRLRETRAHRVLDELRVFRVQSAELHDLLLALQPRERRKRGLDAQNLVQNRRGEGSVERLPCLLGVKLAVFKRFAESSANQQRSPFFRSTITHYAT